MEEEELQTAPLQRQEEEEELQLKPAVQRQGMEEEELQMKSLDGGGFALSSDLEAKLINRKNGGTPLPEATRSFMEPRFGADFSAVRVHTGSEAADISRQINAKAFTHGQDIYFGAGAYQPATDAGKRLLAHELTHVVQQTGAAQRVQRKSLNADDILSAVRRIPFLKNKLENEVRGEAMKTHVDQALKAYQSHFGDSHKKAPYNRINHAMMLAMALDNVAQVIAQELYDPGIHPEIAAKLVKAYEGEIKRALREKGMSKRERVHAVELAKTLVSGDPVSQFMHREIRKEIAAKQIRAMATQARMEPEKMFDLLSQRFQSEMAAYTQQQIQETEDTREAYNIKETPGELSMAYYRQLFGDVATPQWKTSGGTGLKFTTDAQGKLNALRDEVITPSPSPTGLVPRPGLNEKQEQHLQEIEAQERSTGMGNARDELMAVLMQNFNLVEDQARELLTRMENWLPTVPLTITVKGLDWFGRTSKYLKRAKPPDPRKGETKFRAATTQQKTISTAELFEKEGLSDTVTYTGKYEHPRYAKERGETYLRFRKWKDQLMTSLLDFKPEELPTFGAVNLNWETTRSSKGSQPEDYGVNYYGDTHFVLKRDNVKERVVYTATDHGTPRRNILLALHDFAMGGSHTGLKNVQKMDIVADVVNMVTGKRKWASELPFEIQVFGTVDIAQDVEKIYVAPSVAKVVKSNVKAFSKKHNVPYEILKQPKGETIEIPFSRNTRIRTTAVDVAEAGLQKSQRSKLVKDDKHVREFQIKGYHVLNMAPKTQKDRAVVRKANKDFKDTYNLFLPENQQGKIKRLYEDVQHYVNSLPNP